MGSIKRGAQQQGDPGSKKLMALPVSIKIGQYKKGSIKSGGVGAARNGQYKKRGAAATRIGQDVKRGRCRNEERAV